MEKTEQPTSPQFLLLARTRAEGQQIIAERGADDPLISAMRVVSLTEDTDLHSIQAAAVYVAPGADWGMPEQYRTALIALASNLTENRLYLRGGGMVAEQHGPHVNFLGETGSDPTSKLPLDAVVGVPAAG